MSLKGFLKGRTFTRRSVVKGTAAGAALAGAATVSGCATKPAAKKLAIVHTNDTHGHDLLNEESLGMAAAVQLRADYEAQGYEVLLPSLLKMTIRRKQPQFSETAYGYRNFSQFLQDAEKRGYITMRVDEKSGQRAVEGFVS